MKLPVNLLLERLQEHCTVEFDSVFDSRMMVQRPMLYSSELSIVPGGLYITPEPGGRLYRDDICTILSGGARPRQKTGLFICVSEPLGEVMQVLQRLWDEIEDWRARLEDVILRHGELQALLQIALEQLDNPIFVTDLDFAAKGQIGEKWMPQEMRFFDPDADNFDLYVALQQDPLYHQRQLSDAPFLMPAHILPLRTWNLNLFRAQTPAWHIMVAEYRRPLHHADGWLLSCIAPYVSCLLEQEQQSPDSASALHAAFRSVLSDYSADYVEISRRLTRLGWKAGDSYLCAVFSPQLSDNSSVSTIRICSHMEKQYPFCCSLSYESHIVCFFDLTKAGMSAEELGDSLKFFIRDSFLKTGYSRVTQGHNSLRWLYVQAVAALRIGSRVRPHFWIHYFDNVAFQFLLEQSTSLLPVNMICHAGLLKLREHDESQGTAYMETLRVLLDNQLNASETARQLFIHRSTLLYRLENIKELLESDLDDAEELLFLSMSFRLLEAEENAAEKL